MSVGLRGRTIIVFGLLFSVVSVGAAGANYLLLRNALDSQYQATDSEEFVADVEALARSRNVEVPKLLQADGEITMISGIDEPPSPWISVKLADGSNSMTAAEDWLQARLSDELVNARFENEPKFPPTSAAEFDAQLFVEPLAAIDIAAPGTTEALYTYLTTLQREDGGALFAERPRGDGDICRAMLADCEELIAGLASIANFQPPTETMAIIEEAAELSLNRSRDAALQAQLQTSILISLASIALALGAAWLVMKWLLRPVREVTLAAQSASVQSLGQRISRQGPEDELKDLADTFDAMLERLERSFEAQRRFTSNAAHELKTPLAVMRAEIDAARLEMTDDDAADQELLNRLERAALRSERLVEALLDLARAESSSPAASPVDLTGSVGEALLAKAGDLAKRGLEVDFDVPDTGYDTVVAGERELIDVLVANVIDNAAKYAAEHSTVLVRVAASASGVELRVANDGPKLSAGTVEGLMEPFRRGTARTGADGHGLGLSIVAALAKAHGATVELRGRPDGGLVVVVLFTRLAEGVTAPRPDLTGKTKPAAQVPSA